MVHLSSQIIVGYCLIIVSGSPVHSNITSLSTKSLWKIRSNAFLKSKQVTFKLLWYLWDILAHPFQLK